MTLENATLANISFSDTKITLKKGTAAEWTEANPVLAVGEPAFETDTGILKIGDGVTAYNSLDYVGTESFSGSEIDTLLNTVNRSNISATHKITRSATLVIAASDSSAKSKAQADYVCGGTADNVEIQAALDALPDAGGEIHLLEGTYQLAATVTRAIDNVTISGCGYSTYVKYNNSSFLFSVGSQANWLFSNMRIDYGYLEIGSATQWALSNIWRDNYLGVPKLIDSWSYDNIAPRSSGNFTNEIFRHPLVQLIDDFSTNTWTAVNDTCSLETDTSIYRTSGKSVKVTTLDGIAHAKILCVTTYPDLTNSSFGMWVYTPDSSKIASIRFYIHTSSSSYQNYTANLGYTVNDHWVFLPFPYMAGSGGTPDTTNIAYITIWVTPVTGQIATVYIDSIYHWKRCLAPSGAVTFTFDDGYPGVYTLAKPKFDKHGYKAVFAPIASRIDANLLAMSQDLQNNGWDIVNHSYDHNSPRNLADPATSYLLAQKWLADNGFKSGSNFAILYGGQHDAKMCGILENNITMSRSTTGGYNSLPVSASLLRTQNITNTVTPATVQGYLDIAKANGLWLNLTFHNIVNTSTGEYEYPIADLETIIDYCNLIGIEVLTYSQIVDRIRSTAQKLTLSGTGTITNETTSVNIRHGFHKAPSSIQVTPTSSLGSAASLWVSSKDTGTGNLFTVSVNDDPGADVTFEWTAVL